MCFEIWLRHYLTCNFKMSICNFYGSYVDKKKKKNENWIWIVWWNKMMSNTMIYKQMFSARAKLTNTFSECTQTAYSLALYGCLHGFLHAFNTRCTVPHSLILSLFPSLNSYQWKKPVSWLLCISFNVALNSIRNKWNSMRCGFVSGAWVNEQRYTNPCEYV